MSDETTEPTPAQGEAETQPEEHLTESEWQARARQWEKRAKENKAAADRLAEMEEAQKSAEQKAAERLAEAERKAAEAEARAARASVSASTGIPVEILAGPDDGSAEALQAFADRLAAYIEDRGKPRQPRPDPAQGNGRDLALNGDGLEAALRAKLGVR